MSDMDLLLRGYRQTTAQILYWMPDHAHILQSFTWQMLDLAPRFPRLHAFLDYWRENIDATVHQVLIAHQGWVEARDLRVIDAEYRLH